MAQRCKRCRGVCVEEWARVRMQVHRLRTRPHMDNTVYALTLAFSTSLTCTQQVFLIDPFARSRLCCCHADGVWHLDPQTPPCMLKSVESTPLYSPPKPSWPHTALGFDWPLCLHLCCCHADGGWLPGSPSAAAHL